MAIEEKLYTEAGVLKANQTPNEQFFRSLNRLIIGILDNKVWDYELKNLRKDLEYILQNRREIKEIVDKKQSIFEAIRYVEEKKEEKEYMNSLMRKVSVALLTLIVSAIGNFAISLFLKIFNYILK